MPWTVACDGQALHVALISPLDEVAMDEVVDAISAAVTDGVQMVFMPAKIRDASLVAQATLAGLWDMLVTHGVVVRRDDGPEGPVHR